MTGSHICHRLPIPCIEHEWLAAAATTMIELHRP